MKALGLDAHRLAELLLAAPGESPVVSLYLAPDQRVAIW